VLVEHYYFRFSSQKFKSMKQKKLLVKIVAGMALLTGGILYAADHIDAPAVTNQASDITDLYVFRAQDPNNLVFVANTQGLLAPSATGAAKFNSNTLIEFNVDVNNDNKEDYVIQCIYDQGSNKVKVYGPAMPSEIGTRSKLEGGMTVEVGVTAYGAGSPITATSTSGVKVFAGPRDDPFFFDLNRYKEIIMGTATGFNNPGTDTFAGTNVLSIVVEVPKSMFGTVTGGKANVWVETKRKV
jgi:hypothetical protein